MPDELVEITKDKRTLDYSDDLQRRSKRARMRYRREQGLPLNTPKKGSEAKIVSVDSFATP